MEITPQANPSTTTVPTHPAQARIHDHLSEFTRFVEGTTAITTTQHSERRPETLRAWLDLAEAYRITQALRECNGNRSAAARLLGIGRRTLYAKMEKLGITPTWRMA